MSWLTGSLHGLEARHGEKMEITVWQEGIVINKL